MGCESKARQPEKPKEQEGQVQGTQKDSRKDARVRNKRPAVDGKS